MVAESNSFGDAVLTAGAFSVITVALAGVLSLGYYGLGLSSEPSAIANLNSQRWSDEVKINIQFTYVYLFASFYVCMVAAYLVYSSPLLFSLFSSPLMVLVDFFIETTVQYGRSFGRLSSEGVVSEQKLAWLGYSAFLGGLSSPSLLFGPVTVEISLHVTFFVVVVLTIIALTAPVGKFAAWERNLRIFEMVVLFGTIGSSIIPVTTPPGALAFAVSFYGGLILFQLFFLCHSQEAHITALNATRNRSYCPAGVCVPMLLDAISIFSRLVVMVPTA